MNRFLVVSSYIEEKSSCAKQGSIQWKRERMRNKDGGFTVGGSNMTAFIEPDIYHTIGKFQDVCLELDNFTHNLFTASGNVYETVSDLYIEYITGRVKYEAGSIQSRYPRFKYSMDGLIVLSSSILESMGVVAPFIKSENIVLLEIKNPYNGDLTMKKSYEIQLKSGLVAIEPAEMGLLGVFRNRICNLNQMDWTNSSNTNIQKKALQYITDETIPKAVGLFTIYKVSDYLKPIDVLNNEKTDLTDLSDLIDYEHDQNIDFGYSNEKLLGALFGYMKDGKVKYHTELALPDLKEDPGEYLLRISNAFIKKNNCDVLGYLPFKIMDVAFKPLEKDEKFLDPYMENIEEICSDLDKLDKLPYKERRSAIEERMLKSQKIKGISIDPSCLV